MKKLLGIGDEVTFKLGEETATAIVTHFKVDYVEATHNGKTIKIPRADVIL